MDGYGIVGDTARAAFLKIHQSQYTRARNNSIQPSHVFITRVLTALPQVAFERLFEVVEVDPEQKAAS
jgi:hypothetical protein